MGLSLMEQRRRGEVFQALHAGPDIFVVANAWDAGSAHVLAAQGFSALATTSSGFAQTMGLADGLVSRTEALDNARSLVAATSLPVTADLESGFGATPEEVAETIRLAAEAGLSGGSVEDSTTDEHAPIRPLTEATERVRAATEAAHAQDFPFLLTARCENYLHGRPDLDDTIRRLQAYEEAGADVLFAPGLPDATSIAAVCSAVNRPVNVLATSGGQRLSVGELAELGVRRVSLGGTLARAVLGTVLAASHEVLDKGTFDFTAGSPADANSLLAQERSPR